MPRRRWPPCSPPGAARGTGALVDGVLTTGLVAGTANLVNLLDLRPGRAGEGRRPRRRGDPRRARPGDWSPARSARPLAVLPADLGERVMLGDAGANALGALLGLRLAAGPSAGAAAPACSPASSR